MNGENPASAESPHPAARGSVRDLAALFFRLGSTAFGGPAAHVAMMEDEVVRRRRWLTHERFLDLLGAANLIPGPNSTEMAIHIGYDQAGGWGLVTAGACFIVPASLITLVLAWSYVRFGSLPQAQGVLYGVKPVIIAIVAQAIWRLGRAAIKNWQLAALATIATAASFLDVNELVVLFGAGAVMIAAQLIERRSSGVAILAAPAAAASTATGAVAAPFGLMPLFLFFLKVGAVLFGSGYVLIAFLRTDLVDRFHWLTEAQLLDAIAIGQITPGPVSSTATFIGYLLGGDAGALVATAGIFLPSFFFVALTAPIVWRLRSSPVSAAFLDGVNAGALALMVVVTWQLGFAAIVDVPTIMLAAASIAVLLATSLNSAWLILGGALAGFALRGF